MLLKRFFKKPEDWVKETDAAGNCTNPPPLDYVSLGHTGTTPEQNFSGGLINTALAEGWATISKGKLTLHVHPEDLVFTIKRMPGRYCCHCGEKLADDATGELARGHVAAAHHDTKSPDSGNPAGYCMTSAYECVLDAEQHEKFRVKKAGKPPVFARKEAANG